MSAFIEWVFEYAPTYIAIIVVLSLLISGFFYVVFAAIIMMNVSIVLGISMLTVAPIGCAYWAYIKAMKRNAR